MKNSYFPIVLYSEACSEVKTIYDEIMVRFETDFVFNYFKAHAKLFGIQIDEELLSSD